MANKKQYNTATEPLARFILSGYLTAAQELRLDLLADVLHDRLTRGVENTWVSIIYAFVTSATNPSESLQAISAVIAKIEPSDAQSNLLPSLLRMRAFFHAVTGDAIHADTDLQSALTRDPTNHQALYLHVKVLRGLKRLDDAMATMEQFLSVAPRNEPELPQV